MLLDLILYVGMAALAGLWAGTLLSMAHVDVPAWITLTLSWGWLLIVLAVPAALLLPWVSHVFGRR